MSNALIRSDKIVWEEMNGNALLVDVATGERWTLNASAAAIWKHCNGRTHVTEIASNLASNGNHALNQIRRDVHTFCATLLERGLLKPCTEEIHTSRSNITPYTAWNIPELQTVGVGSIPRRRPSPRGNSGPG